jgi:hypothetical protein
MPDGQDLQSLCDAGQRALIATDYLAAEEVLAQAESLAWNAQDWDALSRLYMPLQEARRQRRQRCGEGIVKLDFVNASVPAADIVDRYPHGQLLVAGEASIEPALALRTLAHERKLFVEAFLAARYPAGNSFVIAIVPTADVALPPSDGRSIDRLMATLPPFSIVLSPNEIPRGERPGTDATYAETMALWERLHAPFLAHAEATADPVRRMAAFRKAIEVDYACELAHQHLSKVAHVLARERR